MLELQLALQVLYLSTIIYMILQLVGGRCGYWMNKQTGYDYLFFLSDHDHFGNCLGTSASLWDICIYYILPVYIWTTP